MKKIFGDLSEKVIRGLNRGGLKIQKYSPELCMGLGIIGIVGTVVLACKNTMKAETVIAEHKHEIRRIMSKNVEKEDKEDEKTEKDISKKAFPVYCNTGLSLAKIYAPSVLLGISSIGLILVSNNIIKQRYLGAVASFNVVSKAFEEYRDRVRKEAGEEADRHYMYGAETKTIVDEKDGSEVKEENIERQPAGDPGYNRYFDESNPNWDENAAFNLMFLRAQQNMANDAFHDKGHLFLNEVYDMLGFDRTPVGAVAGWVLGEGDDYIDFGLNDISNENTRRFVNGKSNIVLLDFNISGIIWDKI